MRLSLVFYISGRSKKCNSSLTCLLLSYFSSFLFLATTAIVRFNQDAHEQPTLDIVNAFLDSVKASSDQNM